MKKWLIAIILTFTILLDLIVLVIPYGGVAHAMSGSGTPGDPYIITTIEDFQSINDDLTAYYELANDIDASATRTWNWNAAKGYFEGFIAIAPITVWPIGFTGQIDFKGFKVDGIYQHRPYLSSDIYAFVFLSIDTGGKVINPAFTNLDIYGYQSSVCYLNKGTITKASATGLCNGQDASAGFCLSNQGTITDAYSLVNTNCPIGSGGGAIGFCFQNTGTITNTYFAGTLSGDVMRGFCFSNTGTIISSYWDTDVSGVLTSDGGVGKTTAEMKQQATFSGWDFSGVWGIDGYINNGYPYFIVPSTAQVTTNNATYITMTTARLRGYIIDDNGYPCNVSFEYTNGNGTTLITPIQYGLVTGDMPIYDVTGLIANTTYQYRFKAVSPCGMSYGAWVNFTTKAICVEPSDLLAVSVDNNVSLSWITGSGSANTFIRYKFGGYPTSPTDGALVCLTPGASYAHAGLRSGTTYYYSAWGENGNGEYSVNYTSCMVTTFIGSSSATKPTAPDMTSNWFISTNYTRMQHFPFYGFINTLADTGHIPRNTFWMFGAIFFTVVSSLLVFKKSDGNLLAAVLFAAVMLSISSAMWLVPGLMAGFFLAFALGLGYKEIVR